MKKTAYTLLTTVLMGGLIACVSSAQAQEKKEVKPEVRPVPAAPGGAATAAKFDRTERMAQMLKLNDEQKAKVKPILEEEFTKQREIYTDKNTPPEQRREKLLKLREETSTKLKPILTEEQWAMYSKMRGGVRPAATTPPTAPSQPAPVAPAK
jgi:hypothetical protein